MGEDQVVAQLRRFSQQDWLATSIRTTLSLTGPIGALFGEFLTQFVPGQRLDRLQDYVERLGERLIGLEEQMQQRTESSPAYAHLVEQATVAAVQTASGERRRDLAELLKTGLSKSDAELVEHHALLKLLEQLNDAQILILMRHANFKSYSGNEAIASFEAAHPGVFDVRPPDSGSTDDQRRQWTMYSHYENELISLGLLRDTEGGVKSSPRRKVIVTHLGLLLLDAIGRYSPQKAE